jgi:hypothetical protein
MLLFGALSGPMSLNTLKWMAIQALVFAGGFWFEILMAQDENRPPNYRVGVIIGAIAAFAVTALWLDGRYRVARLIDRFSTGDLKLSTVLSYSAIQCIAFAIGVWLTFANVATAPIAGIAGVGFLFAIGATIIAVNCVKLWRWARHWTHRDAPSISVDETGVRKIGQTSGESHRLGAPNRSLNDLTEGRRSIGPS